MLPTTVANGRRFFLSSTMVRVTLLVVLVGAGWLGTAGGASVQAQEESTAPCRDTLDTAEQAYRNRDYGTAISKASQCTDPDTRSEDTAIRAYRLITLASLRQGALVEARSAVENILQIDPEYTADSVNDPPSYDLFVSMVREDVSPEATDAQSAPSDTEGSETTKAPSMAQADGPTSQGFFLKFGGGISDYTGDYPAQSVGHPLDFQEFTTGSGVPVMASVELGYQMSPGWAVLLGFQVGNYPIVGYKKPTIDDSHRYTPQLLIRYTFRDPNRTVRPYLDVGGNVTFGGERFTSTGAGPSLGGGVSIALGGTTSFYIESRVNVTLPDDAIDAAEFSDSGFWRSFDSVNQLLGVGLRLQFGGS